MSINHYFYCPGILIDLEINTVFLCVVCACSLAVAHQVHKLDDRFQVICGLGTHPCHARQGSSHRPGVRSGGEGGGHVSPLTVALERRNKGPIVWGQGSADVGQQ